MKQTARRPDETVRRAPRWLPKAAVCVLGLLLYGLWSYWRSPDLAEHRHVPGEHGGMIIRKQQPGDFGWGIHEQGVICRPRRVPRLLSDLTGTNKMEES